MQEEIQEKIRQCLIRCSLYTQKHTQFIDILLKEISANVILQQHISSTTFSQLDQTLFLLDGQIIDDQNNIITSPSNLNSTQSYTVQSKVCLIGKINAQEFQSLFLRCEEDFRLRMRVLTFLYPQVRKSLINYYQKEVIVKQLQIGNQLFQEGDLPESAYYIVNGEVRIQKRQRILSASIGRGRFNEKQFQLFIVGEGSLIGDEEIILNQKRKFSAICISQTVKMLEIPNKIFLELKKSAFGCEQSEITQLDKTIIQKAKFYQNRCKKFEQVNQIGQKINLKEKNKANLQSLQQIEVRMRRMKSIAKKRNLSTNIVNQSNPFFKASGASPGKLQTMIENASKITPNQNNSNSEIFNYFKSNEKCDHFSEVDQQFSFLNKILAKDFSFHRQQQQQSNFIQQKVRNYETSTSFQSNATKCDHLLVIGSPIFNQSKGRTPQSKILKTRQIKTQQILNFSWMN